MALILALDLGSTQLKLLVMDEHTQVKYVDQVSYPTDTPRAGWLQQYPADWVMALKKGMECLADAIDVSCISAVSFSGHMSGVVLLNQAGQVLHPCIMLADSRSHEECEEINKLAGDIIRKETGNPVVDAFSLPKLLWLKKNQPKAYNEAVAWVSPKDYLRYLLTGSIATDVTDAYNSLCVSGTSCDWCPEIIRLAGLDEAKFPRLLKPYDVAGYVTKEAAAEFGLPVGIPVIAGGADMACGAVGMGLYEQGDSTLTLGTCATFLSMVPKIDDFGYGQVTYHLHAYPGKIYALGSHYNGGLLVNWLSGILSEAGKIDYAMISDLSRLAEAVPAGSNGLLTIPFIAGSGTPYFNSSDRGTLLGYHTGTTRADIFRSHLEGTTFNLKQCLDIFDELVPGGLQRILLGGGGSKIGIWPRIIADVFGKDMEIVSNADASSVGAAILGGYGAGILQDMNLSAKKALKVRETVFYNKDQHMAYQSIYDRYKKAYGALRALYQ